MNQQQPHVLPAPSVEPASTSPPSSAATRPPVPERGNQATASQQNYIEAPAIADDSDLIEKEWVTRAKQIVSSTHDDPFQQNRSIMKLRADYLKKRYNKNVNIEKA